MNETIVALATPTGHSGLGVVRVSGPAAFEAVCQALQSPGIRKRRATLGVYTTLTDQRLDQVLYTAFVGPKSYTGEDLVELSFHGNPFILQEAVSDLCRRGCRPALPGEFTRRAMVNGKLDLTQAEAVEQLVQASSARALDAAHRQLEGEIGRRIGDEVDRVLQIQAQLEAYIDFPEEDLPSEDPGGPIKSLNECMERLRRLAGTASSWGDVTCGIPTVIAGAPNAGKSSLLNALLGRQRAIVSEQPGTTRDFIAEPLRVGSHLIRLIDTAGVHETNDAIERLGIGLTIEQLRDARIILLLADSTLPLPALPEAVTELMQERSVIIVESKIDRSESRSLAAFHRDRPHARTSVHMPETIDKLTQCIANEIENSQLVPDEGTLMVNVRHAECLSAAANALQQALGALEQQVPTELAATHLRDAVAALGEVVGHIDNEKMLDRLFLSFCIGK